MRQLEGEAARLRAEAEDRLALLGGEALKASPSSSRGVTLAAFGPEELRRLQVLELDDGCVREALATWGAPVFSTRRGARSFQSTVELPGLPGSWGDQIWSGKKCSTQEEAELSAAQAALAAVLADPDLGAELDVGAGDEFQYLTVARGEAVEIVARNRDGWLCCRTEAGSEATWLPATHVAELGDVVDDHWVEEEEEALDLEEGEVVEIISRHYSGWYYCRVWLGLEYVAVERKSGWVKNEYLDNPAPFQELASESLSDVLAEACKVEEILAVARNHPARRKQNVEECSRLTASLSEELDSIGRAMLDNQLQDVKPGMLAVASRNVEAGSTDELRLEQGDGVRVLHADASGWMWCRDAKEVDGWVPRGALKGHQASAAWGEEQLAAASPASPPRSPHTPHVPQTLGTPSGPKISPTRRPECTICLEPLNTGGGGYALPCAHTFHRSCLRPWLVEHSQCPLCRAPVDGSGLGDGKGAAAVGAGSGEGGGGGQRESAAGVVRRLGVAGLAAGGRRRPGTASLLRGVFAGMSRTANGFF